MPEILCKLRGGSNFSTEKITFLKTPETFVLFISWRVEKVLNLFFGCQLYFRQIILRNCGFAYQSIDFTMYFWGKLGLS